MNLDDLELCIKGCTRALTDGVSQFVDEFFICRKGIIYQARKSPFQLLEKYVEPPLKAFFERHDSAGIFSYIRPSRFSKVRISQQIKYTPTHKRYQAGLEMWRFELRKLVRQTDLDEVRNNTELLIYLVEEILRYKPESSRLSFSLKEPLTVKRTKLKPVCNTYCSLCWRFSQRYKAQQSDGLTYAVSQLTDKFCGEHCDSATEEKGVVKTIRRNYMKEQSYKESFHHELKAIYKSNQSNFFPSIKWYINFLGDLTHHEIRKLAYELSHSGLDRKSRVKIMKLLSEGLSVNEIARKLSISPKTVYNNLNFIEKKIEEVYSNTYLHQFTDSPSNATRQERAEEALIWGKSLGIEPSNNEVIRSNQKVRKKPTLFDICNESLTFR